jgi:RNA polymerase sigma factor for flagellar operon FliA
LARSRTAPPGSNPEIVERLVVENLPLVGHLVRDVASKVPGHVSRDELASAAMMALVVCAQNYDESRGVPFPRFAAIRVRGAITDELRGMDWAVRAVRTRAREVDNVRTQLYAVLSRTPRPEEIATALGLTVADLDALEVNLTRAGVVSLHALGPAGDGEQLVDGTDGPEMQLLRREQLDQLYAAINDLPHRLRVVVTSYFFEERKMAEIAAELGVTESRISQMRAEAVRALRDRLGDNLMPTIAARSTADVALSHTA